MYREQYSTRSGFEMTGPHRLADHIALVGQLDAGAAELLCDRHPGDAVAVTVVEPDLTARDLTFEELRDRSARLATALSDLGVSAGDRVATLMGKSAELVIAMLAIFRLGAVYVPLFTAFAPVAIATRIVGNGTKVVITDETQQAKLAPSADLPPDPARRIITTGPATGTELAYADLLAAPTRTTPVAVGGDGTIVELFTSGTTGPPKAVPVPLRAVAAMAMYQEYGLDHQPTDVFWNAADPGWAYGLYQGVLGPLALGLRGLMLRAGFSAELTWSVLDRFGVTNFTAGPTVYRSLRAAPAPTTGLRLRHCSSAGEPLDLATSRWARETLGVGIRDHYGQTELGMVAANAWHADAPTEPPPGSMGPALPGWRLAVLRPDEDEIAPAGTTGRLAVDIRDSPLMWFRGYRDAPERTAERFTGNGRWYLTGDSATSDADGNFFFTARDDDVILMAGYRIGPFEVESVLLQHESVAEAAVTAVPDELRGEMVVAHVVLKPGAQSSPGLVEELRELVKTRLAAHLYPRAVHVVSALPKTPSGKIQRFALRGHDPREPSPTTRTPSH
jgi:acetyl-CoA synthetase